MKKQETVILPGSYDPVTLGHLDIIRRASEEYSEVYAVIFRNVDKEYEFTLEERMKMLILATDGLDNVIVSYSLGYVVDYMREHCIDKIIKGYRNEEDLEYEKIQAEFNLKTGGYETEFYECNGIYRNISSTAARDAIKSGKSLENYLPESVIKYIESK